jgi:hypothetical protein
MMLGEVPSALVPLAEGPHPGRIEDPVVSLLRLPAVPGAICVPPGPVCWVGIFAPDGPGAMGVPPPNVPWLAVVPEGPGAVGPVVEELVAAPLLAPADPPEDPDEPLCAKPSVALPAITSAVTAARMCLSAILHS